MNPRFVQFAAGETGEWHIRKVLAVRGEPLAPAPFLRVCGGEIQRASTWQLRGVTSNERYVTRGEKDQLVRVQEDLGRPQATLAALIPIKKSDAWWLLTQDERRRIFEEQSHHTAIGMRYLPSIARRLHHCRDLGFSEPFDFLTWFEFHAADEPAFDHLLASLRETSEWTHVTREVDIRLEKVPPSHSF